MRSICRRKSLQCCMAEGVKHFYDRLARNYHLIFEDWDASMKRQAAALGAILERECGAPSALRILDCACGIGTQTLGWASLGFTVIACDLSPASVEWTRVEAAKRRLNVQQHVRDEKAGQERSHLKRTAASPIAAACNPMLGCKIRERCHEGLGL